MKHSLLNRELTKHVALLLQGDEEQWRVVSHRLPVELELQMQVNEPSVKPVRNCSLS